MSRALLCVLVLPLLASGAALAQPAEPSAAPAVEVRDAWIRASAPHQDEAVAYLTLTARADDRLVGVSTPIASMVMVHTTEQHGGVMEMREADDGVTLPARQPVSLSPGGTHVMLAGLQRPLRAGETVRLQLFFRRSPPELVQVAVQPLRSTGPAGGNAGPAIMLPTSGATSGEADAPGAGARRLAGGRPAPGAASPGATSPGAASSRAGDTLPLAASPARS